jgi:glycosyltransferase involved in cell wall biosynthesis
VSETHAAELLDACSAFVFCAREDFGIAPIEANAHGAPVVALRAGGVLETMVENETAVFFDKTTVESLSQAIRTALARNWDVDVLKGNAARFSAARFRQGFADVVTDALSGTHW